jgi:hypothetical protein
MKPKHENFFIIVGENLKSWEEEDKSEFRIVFDFHELKKFLSKALLFTSHVKVFISDLLLRSFLSHCYCLSVFSFSQQTFHILINNQEAFVVEKTFSPSRDSSSDISTSYFKATRLIRCLQTMKATESLHNVSALKSPPPSSSSSSSTSSTSSPLSSSSSSSSLLPPSSSSSSSSDSVILEYTCLETEVVCAQKTRDTISKHIGKDLRKTASVKLLYKLSASKHPTFLSEILPLKSAEHGDTLSPIGQLFIGLSTSQTMGLGFHLCAPFFPTTEREAPDMSGAIVSSVLLLNFLTHFVCMLLQIPC